jgi:hypothetical protein
MKINAGALGTIDATADVANAQFGRFSAQQLVSSRGLTQSPSVGSCAVSTFLGLDPTPIEPVKPSFPDAGASLPISSPAGSKTVPRVATGLYSGTLGGVALNALLSLGTPLPDYLNPGTYTISGSGPDVGQFSGPITIPAAVNWTNSAQLTNISRSEDLTITWTGGDPNEFTAISGIGVVSTSPLGPSTDSTGAFLCIVPASAGTFTVPSVVLQALPASSTASLIPTGFLLVGSSGVPLKFTAPNLSAGYLYLTFRTLSGGNVNFK